MTDTDTKHIPVFKETAEILSVTARVYADGQRLPEHWHEGAQLIYASEGVMELTCARGFWVISPNQALWMPTGLPHSLKARGTVRLRTVYLKTEALGVQLPETPQSLMVSPLLRELVLRAESVTSASPPDSREAHLMHLLVDEIRLAHEVPLRLPMPKDARLQKVCLALLQAPGDARNLEDWGHWVGASSRTLARLFQAELRSSFMLWRQHARIFAAIPMLDQGLSISRIAADLGYESAGSFSTAFRRLMGVAPREYRRRSG
ncbi:AraC family transcriptional regulator [Pseudomonas huaxiensis]|uniref:AraC family transcriptional regulator n=1 Tax=Pseudomonas huaxiensis TaxID=2213017 RepID=UPI000DA6BAC8|nr:helix-turn-helix transcriptional regulator [Pseudomonas huaxiensis]